MLIFLYEEFGSNILFASLLLLQRNKPPRLFLWRGKELRTKFVTNFFSGDSSTNKLTTNGLTEGILTVLWF